MVGVKCNFRVERISVPEKKWYHGCFLYNLIHSWYNPLPKSWDTFQSNFLIKIDWGPELSESDVSRILVSVDSTCLHTYSSFINNIAKQNQLQNSLFGRRL